jgi:hypothetical protein
MMFRHSRESGNPFKNERFQLSVKEKWIPAFGLVEKGIDFNVTRNAFIKKHESILQRSQAF